MRAIISMVSLIFLMIIISGCDSESTVDLSKEDFNNVKLISISNSKGLGGLNENYFMKHTEPEQIDIVTSAILDSVKQKSDNIKKPNYDLLITYKDNSTHGLHLLLGKEGQQSSFMFIGQDNTIYKTSAEATSKLRKLIIKN